MKEIEWLPPLLRENKTNQINSINLISFVFLGWPASGAKSFIGSFHQIQFFHLLGRKPTQLLYPCTVIIHFYLIPSNSRSFANSMKSKKNEIHFFLFDGIEWRSEVNEELPLHSLISSMVAGDWLWLIRPAHPSLLSFNSIYSFTKERKKTN